MKQVHWTLPFASLDGEQYRIDIYDDPARSADGGQSWPVQLVGVGIEQGGPLTTDGDSSNNYFAAMRSQTGAIHIVNTSGELSIYDILPEDNIDRPLRLIRVSDGSVMWQGFLKCETYSQGYNARPQQIDLSICSVLDAMKDVSIPEDMVLHSSMSLGGIIDAIIGEMNSVCGIQDFVSGYGLPSSYADVLPYRINPAIFVSKNEFVNGLRTQYTAERNKMGDVIADIAGAFGLVAIDMQDEIMMVSGDETRYTIIRGGNSTERDVVNINMADMQYCGTGHQISVSQTADVVTVNAQMKSVERKIELPAHPRGGSMSAIRRFQLDRGVGQLPVGEVMDIEQITCNTSNIDDAHSNIILDYQKADVELRFDDPTLCAGSNYADSTREEVIQNDIIYNSTSPFNRQYENYLNDQTYLRNKMYAGAFYAKIKHEKLRESKDGVKETNEFDGILCSFFPGSKGIGIQTGFDATMVSEILTMRSKAPIAVSGGTLDLHIKGKPIWLKSMMVPGTISMSSYGLTCYHDAEDKDSKDADYSELMENKSYVFEAELRIGDKYWNGTSWQNTAVRFDVKMDKDGAIQEYDGRPADVTGQRERLQRDYIEVPLNQVLAGYVSLKIFPIITRMVISRFTPAINPYVVDVMMSEISMTFNDGMTLDDTSRGNYVCDDTSTNVYSTRLSTHYREKEVTINTQIGTLLYNNYYDNALKDSRGQCVSALPIGVRSIRPEIHLLGKMEKYYRYPRSVVSLEVKEWNSGLSLIKGYDDKTYLPMSESKNWGTGISTIRCFETPTERRR